MLEACFVWNGRIGRLAYFGYSLALGAILLVVALVLVLPTRNSPNGPMVAVVVVSLLTLVALYAGFCLCAKRLHDVNMSAWHYIWMVLFPGVLNGAGTATHELALSILGSVISLAIGLFLLFWPGTDGSNRFGYPP